MWNWASLVGTRTRASCSNVCISKPVPSVVTIAKVSADKQLCIQKPTGMLVATRRVSYDTRNYQVGFNLPSDALCMSYSLHVLARIIYADLLLVHSQHDIVGAYTTHLFSNCYRSLLLTNTNTLCSTQTLVENLAQDRSTTPFTTFSCQVPYLEQKNIAQKISRSHRLLQQHRQAATWQLGARASEAVRQLSRSHRGTTYKHKD